MDISLFLAQAFGIFFVITGLGLVLQPSVLQKLFTRYSSNRADVMMGGVLSLIVGIPLVLVHNIWQGTWEILVTVIVWITFLKGMSRVLLPDMVVSMAHKMQHKHGMVKAMLWIMIVLGAYLMYVGFGV